MKKKIQQAAITGVHGYVPDYILTNAELEKMVATSDEWITSRTGIKERRILKGEAQGSSVMGIKAVQGLLEKTGTDPLEIDLLICATITPDFITPATGNIISHGVGATNAFSYDLNAACSGFLYALETGAQFIAAGKYKKVVVVGVDKMSSMVDYTDRTTCIIFGDGAGAVLLTPSKNGLGIVDSILKTDGEGEHALYQKGGGSRYPSSHTTVDAKEHYIYQDGKTVFKAAVTGMSDTVMALMQRNSLTNDDLTFLIPHQANQRIIKAVGERIGLAPEKAMSTMEKLGNTTGATLPLCLWKYESQLKPGDKIIFTAFGGGFTWGALYTTWGYDGAQKS